MTAKPRPVPPHGSEARYKGSTIRPGCRCRTCITGWTRAGKRRHLARLQGQPSSLPSGPVTAHIAALYDSGLSTVQIAAAASVSTSTILDHANGNLTNIHRSRAAKILAVKPGQETGVWRTTAVGTQRRIQALYTLGHGSTAIAAAAGMSANGVSKILDASHVSIHTRDAIAAAYKKLIHQPGTSARARAKATASGWHGPLAWDDIDDPAALPEVDEPSAPVSERRDPSLAEEVQHLASFGISTAEIARRLNRTESYIRSQLRGDRAPGWRQKLEAAA